MRTVLLPVLLLLCVLAGAAGCGYTVAGGTGASAPTVLPAAYGGIALRAVHNPTMYTWLGPELRSLLREELIRRGYVWADEGGASALLTVRVQRYTVRAQVKNAQDETLRFVSELRLTASITGTEQDDLLWSSGTVATTWPHATEEGHVTDREVLVQAVRDLADRMGHAF
jgi:hypothetical protein